MDGKSTWIPHNNHNNDATGNDNGYSQLIKQLSALGRNESYPWVLIRCDKNKLYAYHYPRDILWKLNSRQARADENYTSEKDQRARFSDGCLKFHFGHRWDNGSAKLENLAKKGHDLCLIPNYIPLDPKGENGIGANFVAAASTLFTEIDDCTIPEQWERIKEISSNSELISSLVVFSGSKSLHIFFKLQTPITDLAKWRKLQKKLICILGGDPATCNPDRASRLAGVERKSKESFQSIEFESDRAYSIEEIESLLDQSGLFPYGLGQERWSKYQQTRREEGLEAATAVLQKPEEEINPPRRKSYSPSTPSTPPSISEVIPIERCLSREKQDLLNGVSSERNNTMYKLGLTLLQTEEYLQTEGIAYSGDAEDLFYQACEQCTPGDGWNHREWSQIWRSCESRKHQCVLIDEEAINGRIRYYNWEQAGFPNSKEEADQALFDRLGESPTSAGVWFEQALHNAINAQSSCVEKFLARSKVKSEEQSKLYERVTKNPKSNYKPGKLNETEGPIKFEKGQRAHLYSEANALGYKFILDKSGTGEGKTHDAANMNPDNFDFGSEINENNEEIPIRGQLALFASEPDKLPIQMDSDWTRLPKITKNTCSYAEARSALSRKGIGGSGGQGQKDSNPFCQQCEKLFHCRNGSGEGYGQKYQMKEALASPKIYGHHKGLPREDNSKTIAVFDEFSKVVPPTETTSIGLKELSKTLERLEQRDCLLDAYNLPNDHLYDDLKFLKFLIPYLNGNKQVPYPHGVNLAEMRQKYLPDWSESKIQQIIEAVDQLEEQWQEHDLKQIHKSNTAEDVNFIVDEPWLGRVLKILFGYSSGALRIGKQKSKTDDGKDKLSEPMLLITETNDSAINKTKSFRMAVLLDATLTKQDLVFQYGLDPEEILEVEQVPTQTPNLKIKQLTNAGLNTSQRSQAGQQRKEQISSAIQSKHSQVGIIDYRQHAIDGELHHFRSGDEGARGSNKFQDKDALISFGVPYPAVNNVLDSYQSITGESVDNPWQHEGFNKYYKQLIQKEIVQEVGRLRANLRPNQALTVYMINDLDPFDLSFLGQLGLEVTRQPIWHIAPELKPKQNQYLEQLAHFFASLYHRSHNILKAKQKDAAVALDCKASALSRLVKELGGWIQLKQKINNLFFKAKRDVNFSDVEELIQSELFEIYGFDLLDSEEQLVAAIEEHGWQKVENYFDLVPVAQKGEMMALFLLLLSKKKGIADWLAKLREILMTDFNLEKAQLGISSPPSG